MRLHSHDLIWIKDGGRDYPGYFIAYKGRGMVKTVSERFGTKNFPRIAIRPRKGNGVSA